MATDPKTRRQIQLSPAQTDTLEAIASETGATTVQVIDAIYSGYLRDALDQPYPTFKRVSRGKRRNANRSGIHSFIHSPEQLAALARAQKKAGGLSYAQLLEAAASDQLPKLYPGRLWPTFDRAEMPWGRGNKKSA